MRSGTGRASSNNGMSLRRTNVPSRPQNSYRRTPRRTNARRRVQRLHPNCTHNSPNEMYCSSTVTPPQKPLDPRPPTHQQYNTRPHNAQDHAGHRPCANSTARPSGPARPVRFLTSPGQQPQPSPWGGGQLQPGPGGSVSPRVGSGPANAVSQRLAVRARAGPSGWGLKNRENRDHGPPRDDDAVRHHRALTLREPDGPLTLWAIGAAGTPQRVAPRLVLWERHGGLRPANARALPPYLARRAEQPRRGGRARAPFASAQRQSIPRLARVRFAGGLDSGPATAARCRATPAARALAVGHRRRGDPSACRPASCPVGTRRPRLPSGAQPGRLPCANPAPAALARRGWLRRGGRRVCWPEPARSHPVRTAMPLPPTPGTWERRRGYGIGK